ncbi:MAG: FmdB family zinc ribbon protein [Pyrinomonadaceae bacterium]
MPIYEYKCQQCGLEIEKRQSVSDAPLTTCEKCHGKLEKQWSLSGFQFKGAGWYVTDYAAKKADKSDKSDKSEKGTPAESTAKPETASKSKDEVKTTPKETVAKPAKE